MEPAGANLSRGRRAVVLRRRVRLRRGLACRDAPRHGRARGNGDRRTVGLAHGRGGARARRLPRRPRRLLGRHLHAHHLRAAGDDRPVRSHRARDLLSLEVARRGLRAPGADRGANVGIHGQFRLLGRLAVGRSLAAHPRAVATRCEHPDQLFQRSAADSRRWPSSSAGPSCCSGSASGPFARTGDGWSISSRCSPPSISTRNGSSGSAWSRCRSSSAAS